ncbi:MAG: hypothetical protein ACLU79_13415 [Clostridium sp.]
MKKKAVVIAMAAALAVSQYAAVFAANSPGSRMISRYLVINGDLLRNEFTLQSV